MQPATNLCELIAGPSLGFSRDKLNLPQNTEREPSKDIFIEQHVNIGCPGRDRTRTFLNEFWPLNYKENFASKSRFPIPETFGTFQSRNGSLETAS